MRDLFSGPFTIIGPSAPPVDDHDFWTLEHYEEAMKKRLRQCDTCTLSSLKRAASNVTGERDPELTEIREPFEMFEDWGEDGEASNVRLAVDEDAIDDGFLDDGDIAMPDMDDTDSDGNDSDGARSKAGSDDSYVD
ncbi:hypothetical protein FSHL1_010361 [Fusarium sambucinum]